MDGATDKPLVLQIAQCPVSIRGIGYDRRGKMQAMSLVRMCEPFVARGLKSRPEGAAQLDGASF